MHRSTVHRELARGRDPDGLYHAPRADERARARARSSAANHPTKPAALWRWVAQRIAERASPDQVVGRLAHVCPSFSVSVPAIYAFVRREERGGGELHSCLRYAHKRALSRRGCSGGMPKNRPSIRHRPKHIQLRKEPGHWEADTVLGNHSHPSRLLTVVERTSRYTRLGLLPNGTALPTSAALKKILRGYLVRSITFDNGVEFAYYASACAALGAAAYFAEPSRPWQRGTNENTNGLIRQYIPKYRSMAKLTVAQLRLVEHELNHRPRRCLGYLTPHEVHFSLRPTPVALRT